jgi:hypothetical protein
VLKIAEVRNFEDDETMSGRVLVRIYNEQNDEQNVKDEDLAWASVGLPVSSASTHKIGMSPSGLRKGSRVLLAFLPHDVNQQHPIVLCSLQRGDYDKEKEGDIKKQDKQTGGKPDYPGVDNAMVGTNVDG